MIEFESETAQRGVTERLFTLDVAGERVPAVLWAPTDAQGPRPLLLMGHGASQDKKTLIITARAQAFARRLGYATLALDAPGHGARVSAEERAALSHDIAGRISGQEALSSERARALSGNARQAVPEWRAALDAVTALPFIGAEGPVGYWGVSMGTFTGVPLAAAEPRIKAAVFGLAGLRSPEDPLGQAARALTIPIRFVFQWHDEIIPREEGLALFDAFGSKDKAMHITPGGHLNTPRAESDSWENFYVRHLGKAADAPA